MNSIPSMDRHIQQTNDRLQCIKQVRRSAGPLMSCSTCSSTLAVTGGRPGDVPCVITSTPGKRGHVDLGAVLMAPTRSSAQQGWQVLKPHLLLQGRRCERRFQWRAAAMTPHSECV